MHIVYTAKPSRKHITSHNNEQNAVPVLLCLECSNHLVTIDNAAEASLCQHSWPGYIWSFLTNIDMHRQYGEKIWRFIPIQWRYWWISEVKRSFPTVFANVSIESPTPIFADRTSDINEWNQDIDSYLLSRLASTCNKHLMPSGMCPWGCTEYIHRYVKMIQ